MIGDSDAVEQPRLRKNESQCSGGGLSLVDVDEHTWGAEVFWVWTLSVGVCPANPDSLHPIYHALLQVV